MKAIRVQCARDGDKRRLIARFRPLRPLASATPTQTGPALSHRPLGNVDSVKPGAIYWRRRPSGMPSTAAISGICARAAVIGGIAKRGTVVRHKLSKERTA